MNFAPSERQPIEEGDMYADFKCHSSCSDYQAETNNIKLLITIKINK